MVYVNQKFYGEANCNGGLTVTLQKGDIMKLSHLYGQEFKGWYVDDKRITSRAEVEIRETEYPSGTVFYAILEIAHIRIISHTNVIFCNFLIGRKRRKSMNFLRFFLFSLKSATKSFIVLFTCTRSLITELLDKLRLKYPLLPTIPPYPTMRLETIRSIIPISCSRHPKSVWNTSA